MVMGGCGIPNMSNSETFLNANFEALLQEVPLGLAQDCMHLDLSNLLLLLGRFVFLWYLKCA
jgi:hypothetical protein